MPIRWRRLPLGKAWLVMGRFFVGQVFARARSDQVVEGCAAGGDFANHLFEGCALGEHHLVELFNEPILKSESLL